LGVAARVFASRGYDRTSMRDLARAARMSLSGMYYYTRGKEDLLFQIQKRCFEQVQRGAQEAIRSGHSAEERLAAFIRHHVCFFATHMAEMKVLAHEAESLTGRSLEEVRLLKKGYVRLLVRLLKELDGRPDSRAERQVAAYTLFGMMNWIYTWYDPAGPVDVAGLADAITALFLNGYSAEVLVR
jgi:AcrR family transcriptional regulator